MTANTLMQRVTDAYDLADTIAGEDRRPTALEMEAFKAAGWDSKRVRQELGRAAELRRLAPLCGTEAQRQKAFSEAEEAEAEAAETDRRIDEVIAKLNAERAQARSKAVEKRRKSDGFKTACEKYMNNLPQHIVEEHRSDQAKIEGGFDSRMNRLADLVQLVERAAAIDIATINGRADAVHIAEQACPEAIVRGKTLVSHVEDGGQMFGRPERVSTATHRELDTIDPGAWRQWLAAERAQVPEWKAEIEQLREQKAEAVAACKDAFYARHLPKAA